MSARRWIVGAVASATALVTLGLGGLLQPAEAASTAFGAPSYAGDFPDPSVLVDGGTYWAYATGTGLSNLQVMSSPDMRSWTAPADPLPRLPSWASGGTWAPDVIRLGDRFVMYYSARVKNLGIECISVAFSVSPGGPFLDISSAPLVCQTHHGGSIDPNPYLDPASGRLYLFWKSEDNTIHGRTGIWAQALSPDGFSLAWGSSPVLVMTQSASWQAPCAEGPTVVRAGGLYFLFYGANSWRSASSGIGYAISRSLLGKYTNESPYRPWLATKGTATGPQGPMVFTDAGGATRMAFVAWHGPVGYRQGGTRALRIGRLTFGPFAVPALS